MHPEIAAAIRPVLNAIVADSGRAAEVRNEAADLLVALDQAQPDQPAE